MPLKRRGLELSLGLTLTLLIGGTGCGSKKSDPPPAETNQIPTASLSEAQKLAKAGIVHCSNESECSPSVALVTGTTPESAYQCTGFLIAPDILATNSHCIPSDLKAPGSPCADRLWAFFPGVAGARPEQAGCARVLTSSELKEGDFSFPDYAFIRLERPLQRPVLTITHEGIPVKGAYRAIKVDPYHKNGVPEGYMKQAECKAVAGSVLLPQASSPEGHSKVAVVADCTVIHGNSGSPLLTADGKVAGIAYASLDDKAALERMVKRAKLKLLDGRIADLGFVTSYACIATPVESRTDLAPWCAEEAPPSGSTDASSEALADSLDREIARRMLSERGQLLNRIFRWQGVAVKKTALESWSYSEDYYVLPVPACVRDMKQLLRESAVGGRERPRQVERKENVPLWGLKLGLNAYLQVDYRFEGAAVRDQELILSFNAEELATRGKSEFKVTASRTYYGSAVELVKGELARCEEGVRDATLEPLGQAAELFSTAQ